MAVTVSVTKMRLRAAALAALCLGLNACTLEAVPMAPVPAGAVGPAQPVQAGPAGRAGAIDEFIVVRKAGSVRVLRRLDAKPLWTVPQRPNDPIIKARLARGSIVVVRRSLTVEVYDLKTGQVRFTKKAAAVGVSWTTLFVDSDACQPDCALRGYDLGTGEQLWAGPIALPGKVMVEPGESPDAKYSPPGEFAGPLRAPEASTIAVRGSEGVMFLDAATGQELSRVPLPAAGFALGSGNVLLEWAAAEPCTVRVAARDAATGEVSWQVLAGTRLPEQPSVCFEGWRPDIADGLIVINDAQRHAKVLEVDTGKVRYGANPLGDPAVGVNGRAVYTVGSMQLAAFKPDAEVWATRLWAAGLSETSTVAGFVLDFDRLLYTTQYAGSPTGIGWVRDAGTGKRLWYGDGLTPLGVDGDRVIVEAPNGEIRLEPMVS